MKPMYFSAKKLIFSRITRLGWTWIGILWVCAILFYSKFFDWWPALGLGSYMTFLLVTMMLVGYLNLGPQSRFPTSRFLVWTAIFSIIRYLYIYFFLSKHLPPYSIFHYVDRVIPSLIFTTGGLIFLGYSYAIYEWGLAAREKYAAKQGDVPKRFSSPVTIRSEGKTIYLLPEDILFVKANGEYVDFHTTEKKYICYQRLKNTIQELEQYGFIRCHRSFIVNVRFVKSLSKNQLQLENGEQIPIGKKYLPNLESLAEQKRM